VAGRKGEEAGLGAAVWTIGKKEKTGEGSGLEGQIVGRQEGGEGKDSLPRRGKES